MRHLTILLALVLYGCRTERSLTITSDPPGAEVRLDDQAVGVTPVRVTFEHYGTRRVSLHKTGYRTQSDPIHLRAPWYFRFPIDIVTEFLLPFGWKDRRVYHVDLQPGEEDMSQPSLRSVIERANVLRQAGPEGPRQLPETRPQEVPPAEDEDTPESGGGG